MRCLFKHKWIVGGVFDPECFAPWRVCTRCGRMQRNTSDFSEPISWETMRERNHITLDQIRIARQPISSVEQLAHKLRLRRTRMSDRPKSARRSLQS